MITAGSVITATIRISPWHRGQVSGSTSKMRRSSSGQRNRAARSGQSTGSTIATGASAASLACRRRAPRVRLAYQPSDYATKRIVFDAEDVRDRLPKLLADDDLRRYIL